MKNNKNTNSVNGNGNENINYLLYSVSNYKPCINYSVSDILTKFVSVIIEYMRFISEKITMKNKQYYRFIFERGVETLIHIFSVIFYYTKNLDLTYYHTQKAYYFYIEFMEQISDDAVTFLQLSSRDAIMFVYKKTIFELNNEYRKNIPESPQDEINILSIIDTYTNIYKSIIQFIINHKDFKYDNKLEYINKCCDSIENVSEILNKNKFKKGVIDCIYIFTNLLADKKIDIKEFFVLLDEFIKKIHLKKKVDIKTIKNKIYDSEINTFIMNNEFNKISDWILTE
jgi:hypothetical protein